VSIENLLRILGIRLASASAPAASAVCAAPPNLYQGRSPIRGPCEVIRQLRYVRELCCVGPVRQRFRHHAGARSGAVVALVSA